MMFDNLLIYYKLYINFCQEINQTKKINNGLFDFRIFNQISQSERHTHSKKRKNQIKLSIHILSKHLKGI